MASEYGERGHELSPKAQRQGTDFLLESPEGRSSADTLVSGLEDLCQTSNSQKCRRINPCCFKPLNI